MDCSLRAQWTYYCLPAADKLISNEIQQLTQHMNLTPNTSATHHMEDEPAVTFTAPAAGQEHTPS